MPTVCPQDLFLTRVHHSLHAWNRILDASHLSSQGCPDFTRDRIHRKGVGLLPDMHVEIAVAGRPDFPAQTKPRANLLSHVRRNVDHS